MLGLCYLGISFHVLITTKSYRPPSPTLTCVQLVHLTALFVGADIIRRRKNLSKVHFVLFFKSYCQYLQRHVFFPSLHILNFKYCSKLPQRFRCSVKWRLHLGLNLQIGYVCSVQCLVMELGKIIRIWANVLLQSCIKNIWCMCWPYVYITPKWRAGVYCLCLHNTEMTGGCGLAVSTCLTLTALKYFCYNHGQQRVIFHLKSA